MGEGDAEPPGTQALRQALGAPAATAAPLLAASAAARPGLKLPHDTEGPQGLPLTTEPHGRLPQGLLWALQAPQALAQVFVCPSAVPRQLGRAQGHGLGTHPPHPVSRSLRPALASPAFPCQDAHHSHTQARQCPGSEAAGAGCSPGMLQCSPAAKAWLGQRLL